MPLPIKRKELDRVVQTVFGSRAALEILKKSGPNKRIYQKNLISELNFSNKTIIKALKKLVSAGVLEQGMEKHTEKGRTFWTKSYIPTFQGKWLVLLLRSPENISLDETKEIVIQLFMMYMENIVKLYSHYEIEPEIFNSTINAAFLKMMMENRPQVQYKSRVIVYGSATIDTLVSTDKLPEIDETLYLQEVQNKPGGSAANVATALRRLGVSVSFVGKIGGDANGISLIKEFMKEGIDFSDIIIDPKKRTITTFITVNQLGGKRIYVLGGNKVALSISSPNEIAWNKIEESEMIYVGEVFTEIAELITSYARSRYKKVIYRPGQTIIAFNSEKVRHILRNVNILILNQKGFEAIKHRSELKPSELLKMGPEIVIITKGLDGCETYTIDESFILPSYSVRAIDTTGAGDAFAAGLICSLLEDKDLRECVKYALIVSAISISKKGARTALPSRFEVDEFMRTL